MAVLVSNAATPDVSIIPSADHALIRREGIFWTGGSEGAPLQLYLTFENPAAHPSVPTLARVHVAEFGAFLPWKPLTRVAVPSVPPGGRRVVTTTAAGDAVSSSPLENRVLRRTPMQERRTRRDRLLWSLMRRRMPGVKGHHFVGNLNVFVARQNPVERHIQRAVGLAPDKDNLAMFCVGDGTRDRYTFSLANVEPGWEVEIFETPWGKPVEISQASLMLRIRPPANAESGGVSIAVHRESTAQRVPVEFELETRAPGARCYFL